MSTVGLDELRIAYSAIPRCANTSIKLALFKLSTGREFEYHIGNGPLWPHSTSKLEIHRNDIMEFTHLAVNDQDLIESNYDFWFTILDIPLRRLFSSYYMLVLLEDPHLTAMGRTSNTFPKLRDISHSSIRAHFENFVKSEYLRYLIENDVHFIPQSTLLGNLATSRKLHFYDLSEVAKLESDLNYFLLKSGTKKSVEIPRSNISLLSVGNLDLSMSCLTTVESLYEKDLKLIRDKTNVEKRDTTASNVVIDEKLMSIAINEIRERNRRITAIFESLKAK